jgi:hypothetical protein
MLMTAGSKERGRPSSGNEDGPRARFAGEGRLRAEVDGPRYLQMQHHRTSRRSISCEPVLSEFA